MKHNQKELKRLTDCGAKSDDLKAADNGASRRWLPAMFTLEAAYLVPTFLLIVFGVVRISVELYQTVRDGATAIEANEKIDAVQNFRYTCLGQKILN